MGMMGGKNTIVNTQVKGLALLTLKKILLKNFDIKNVKMIKLVVEGKSVFEIIMSNQLRYRLDVFESSGKIQKKRAYYQKLAYRNDVNVPNILGFYTDEKFTYKLSCWVGGKRAGYYWKSEAMFRKAGIEVAKINLIKDPDSDDFFGYTNFSPISAIFSRNNGLHLINATIEPKKDVDASVAKLLFKNLSGDFKRCNWFLDGYETIRNADRIRDMFYEKTMGQYPEKTRKAMAKHKIIQKPHKKMLLKASEMVDGEQGRIIEIGCAEGNFTQLMEDVGIGNYIGVDVEEYMIDEVRASFPQYKFFNCDIEKNYHILKKAATIVILETIQCINDDLKLLNNILPGTNVIISAPNSKQYYNLRYYEIEGWLERFVKFLDFHEAITIQHPKKETKKSFLFKAMRNEYVDKETNLIPVHATFDTLGG